MLLLCLLMGIGFLMLTRYPRNNKVYNLYLKINQACYEWNILQIAKGESVEGQNSAYEWCWAKLPRYQRIVFSFKKITPEALLPADVIQKFEAEGISL